MNPDTSPARRRRSKGDVDGHSLDGTPQPTSSRKSEDDEVRRDFLERNKLAARRHRERRKDYIANLERSLHMARQQLEDSRQELDSLRHLATSLVKPPAGPPHPPRAYTSNGYGSSSSPPTPVSRPLVSVPQPGEPRILPVAAKARLQALSEVYARAVRSCDDPIPIHCDARFRDLLASAEDAASPIRTLVLECEELSKTCVDASTHFESFFESASFLFPARALTGIMQLEQEGLPHRMTFSDASTLVSTSIIRHTPSERIFARRRRIHPLSRLEE
ncbi:unnamed protein product [Rhizoctonia solani]|uniref:BZIP domain-containing protein n=1 Tax=Rhizoctonia solani TaxID=456999 RepID=A0A8H3HSN1_9AGAM|nr:unnamed protein product [Rhizoctonia solani]